MKLINGNIDQLFKDKLSDYEATASEEVWNNIESDLLSAKKKRLMPVLLKVAAAIILLIGIGGLIIKYSGKIPDSEQITDETQVHSPVQNIEKSLTDENILAKTETNNNAVQEELVKDNVAVNAKMQKPAISKEYIAVVQEEQEERDASNNNMALTAQNSLKPNIENASIAIESDKEISVDLKSKAVPVYQSSQLNSYASLYVEETKSKKDRNLQWSVGGQAGPQYTYRDVIVSDPASQNFNMDDYEFGIVTYAGGLNVQLGTGKRFTIQSGVYYSKIGTNNAAALAANNSDALFYTTNYEWESTPIDIPNSTGSFSYDKSLNLVENSRNEPIEAVEYTIGEDVVQEFFEYLEIPLIIRYKIIDRKLGINLNGGIWTNFLINFDAISNEPGVTITEQPENINKINYSGSLGIGFDYPITNSVLFNLEPLFKYYLSPINKIAESKVHPYTFGIMAGVRYSF